MSLLTLLAVLGSLLVHPDPIQRGNGPQPDDDEAKAPRRTIETVRLSGTIEVDGRLDDEAWAEAPPITGFRQRDPDEGAEPTERTVVRLLYDDEALYIGARLFDEAPDSIVARLGRRDAELDADRFGFFVDPYHDRRSGFYFGINAAGTLYDGVLMNDDWDDESWDGVWQGRVQIDDEGWTAELRIPYSQLRFKEDQYVWGINFLREIARKNERLYLVYTPRDESGFVSRFPDLVGIERIQPPRQLELLPYVTTRAEYTDHAAGDPFNDGSRYVPGAGLDLKYGLTNNLTLNATINPDFGQVEVDPAVVNLSDVETFFPEKRPFFIEGASVFNFGQGGATDNWSFNWGNPDFFYTRRIGRAPQGSLPEADYAERPDGTRILGAAKLTGKVGAWNVGTVHALTQREFADLELDGRRFSAEVEPTAYYGIARAQQEFNEGRQGLGLISTLTARSFRDDRLLDELNGEAFTAGVDGWTFLDRDKTWVVSGWSGLSHVRGTEERILALQQNSLHYFQRPDAGHVSVDSSATSLTGAAGRVAVNKQRGSVFVNAAFGFMSPGFDVNDVGFQWRADILNAHVGMGYKWTEPGRVFRQAHTIGAVFGSKDFDGNTTWAGVWGMFYGQFLNYYGVRANAAVNPETIDNRLTRGGPLATRPPGVEAYLSAWTDSRKPWVFELGGGTYTSERGTNLSLETEVEWRPAGNVSLSVSPGVEWNRQAAQWVGAFDDPTAVATYGRRYVFAELDQVTAAASVRLNWTFTPQLSLQLYAQPLVSSGAFTDYKELAATRTFDFVTYGEGASTFDEESFVADPDGPAGPAAPIALEDQDFTFASLRGNLVLRWEYRPGSQLYLVWTQARSESEALGVFDARRSFDGLLDARPDNIFMVKLTYWLNQ